MWYFVRASIQNGNIRDTINEKLLIENKDCYLVVLGADFNSLSQSNQAAMIENIIDKYSNLTVFWVLDKNVTQIELVRSILRKELGKFKKPDENEALIKEFIKKSYPVVSDYFGKFKSADSKLVINLLGKKKEDSFIPLYDEAAIRMIVNCKQTLNEIMLKHIRVNKNVSICAIDVDSRGKVSGKIFPNSEDIKKYLQEYQEKTKREISLNLIESTEQSQLFEILNDGEFRQNIAEYIDFLNYDFSMIYSDAISTTLNMVKIITTKYLFDFIKLKDETYYFILTSRENEFVINNSINGSDEISALPEHKNRLYKVVIKNNTFIPSDDIPTDYIGRVKENIGIAFPTVVNLAQRVISESGRLNIIEIGFNECIFTIEHNTKWNDSIICKI
jgi:hypothetical protein